MEVDPKCSICDKPLTSDVTKVGKKALKKFIELSEKKEDGKWKEWTNVDSVYVHEGCRKGYYFFPAKKSIEHPGQASTKPDEEAEEQSTSSASDSTAAAEHTNDDFDFQKLCFFCGKKWDSGNKLAFVVSDNAFKERLLLLAELRKDDLGEMVKQRLGGIGSLINAKGRYHSTCLQQFHKKPSDRSRGRPIDPLAEKAFQSVCNHIESSGKYSFLLLDLRKIMGEHSLADKTFYRKLKEKFGNDVYVSHRNIGNSTVIYYKKHELSEIVSDWEKGQEAFGDEQNKLIFTIAADMLKTEILATAYDTQFYNAPGEFLNNVHTDIPEGLRFFLNKLLIQDTNIEEGHKVFAKIDSIGHSIVSFLKPKSFLSHLQLAVGTYIYRKVGSKLLINFLSHLGVCASYHSVQLLEASCMIHPSEMTVKDAMVQLVWDNTDHNAKTLTGKRTFHNLGGIAVYTPASEVSYTGKIEKCSEMPTPAQLDSIKKIPNAPLAEIREDGRNKIEYVDSNKLRLGKSTALPPSFATYLWAKTYSDQKFPSWKGFMEVLSRNNEYHVSRVVCLPFINEPPSKSSTINSALYHSLEVTRKLGQQTCFVTFDQPLYIKARELVAANKDFKDIKVRLGGFHLLMSFLAAICFMMAGSGLEALWSVVYAPDSVKMMMSGHAFSRAMRAHILTYTALGIILCKNIKDEGGEFKKYMDSFLENWKKDAPNLKDCESEAMINEMTKALHEQLNTLEKNGPTAQLWIRYFECITLVLQFVQAERLGDWKLHLQSVHKMLPLFHSTGHYAYAKSAQIYLQDMADLDITMNDREFQLYTTGGFFTIRRTEKPFSGVWTDMTIEQTLNRHFGIDIKHGRGISPGVIARFLLSMPSTVSIMEALEDYCGINSKTSEQHIDLTNSRMQADDNDIKQFMFWLEARNPFQQRNSLQSLSTGIIGGTEINCHKALEKGKASMESMIGKTADKVTLTKLYKVQNLEAAKSGVHVSAEYENINPLMLFEKIATRLHGNADLTRKALKHELSPVPLALFDNKGFMRKNVKSKLYDIFSTTFYSKPVLDSCFFVIDGGFLLHQINWPHGKTFKEICHLYLLYIRKTYQERACVVFDGYNNEACGPKSYERYRRKEKNVAVDVNVEYERLVTLTQPKFLSNICNKQQFVKLLAQYLRNSGIEVREAEEDADTLIVQTALRIREKVDKPVAVLGNDTDLLVLLIALTPAEDNMYFYKIAPSKKPNELFETSKNQRYKENILFGHAFAGCDTTSGMYNKGKITFMNLITDNSDLHKLVRVFYEQNSTENDICSAAEKLILKWYKNDQQEDSIDELRFNKFCGSVMQGDKEVRLSSLPPTKSALDQHAKRVFHQVQTWLGKRLDPQKWGWRRNGTIMVPIMSMEKPAPEELLTQAISCGCQACSKRCSCVKAGITCSQSCKKCHGVSCKNAAEKITSQEPIEATIPEEHCFDQEGEERESHRNVDGNEYDEDENDVNEDEDDVDEDGDENDVDETENSEEHADYNEFRNYNEFYNVGEQMDDNESYDYEENLDEDHYECLTLDFHDF